MSTTRRGMQRFFSFVAFFALMCIGVSLALRMVFSNVNGSWARDLSTALETIATILAFITVAFYAYYYAHRKWGQKQIIYIILWAIAVVLIALHFVF